MSKQWGHGFNKGREQGEEFGKLLGQGEREIDFSKPADRLFLLANALQGAADGGVEKSHVWWQLYVTVIAKEMREISAALPSVLANFAYQVPKDDDA